MDFVGLRKWNPAGKIHSPLLRFVSSQTTVKAVQAQWGRAIPGAIQNWQQA